MWGNFDATVLWLAAKQPVGESAKEYEPAAGTMGYLFAHRRPIAEQVTAAIAKETTDS